MVNMGNDRNIAEGHRFGLVREVGASGRFRPAPQNLAVPYSVFPKSERAAAWLFGSCGYASMIWCAIDAYAINGKAG